MSVLIRIFCFSEPYKSSERGIGARFEFTYDFCKPWQLLIFFIVWLQKCKIVYYYETT